MRAHHPISLVAVLCLAMTTLMPGGSARADSRLERTHSVSFTYEVQHVYAGRLVNAQAAFAMLQGFFDSNPFRSGVTYSFLRDVLRNTMLPDQGYVMTMYGFGYGACGAPSLLNQLVRTAMFRDEDGVERPVFEALEWTRENSATYGRYGVAIFLDLTGPRSKDYVWRLNPAYDGPPPRITIAFDENDPDAIVVTMTMHYADEIAADPAPSQPAEARSPADADVPEDMLELPGQAGQ